MTPYINNQARYNVLMSNSIYLPKHFRKRYKQRVSKSSKGVFDFVKNAYLFGKGIESIKDKDTRLELKRREEHGGACKIYRGFICWFESNRAITVYPISKFKKPNERNSL